MVAALSKFKAIAVMDKAEGFNAAGGPLFTEVTSRNVCKGCIWTKGNKLYIWLGGRDVKADDIEIVYNELLKILEHR